MSILHSLELVGAGKVSVNVRCLKFDFHDAPFSGHQSIIQSPTSKLKRLSKSI